VLAGQHRIDAAKKHGRKKVNGSHIFLAKILCPSYPMLASEHFESISKYLLLIRNFYIVYGNFSKNGM
jgi:hypothetical protein